MGPIGCPETSVRNSHYSVRNNPEERSYQHWKLQSWWYYFFIIFFLVTIQYSEDDDNDNDELASLE
jgi:hypothetical protein